MKSIADKHLVKGRTVVRCKLCEQKVMGEDFLRDFREDKLSAFQRFQLNGLMKLAKKGADAVDKALVPNEKMLDKAMRMELLLFTHFTRRARNKLHRDVIFEAAKTGNGYELLNKYLEIEPGVLKFPKSTNGGK